MKPAKPYREMNTAELAEATAEFNREFIADTFKPLTPELRAKWDKARKKKTIKGKPSPELSLKIRSNLLIAWLTAQAKKRKMSRSKFVSNLLETARSQAKA